MNDTGYRTSGQWLEASDGQRWWFDSGSLCLDFAYTGALNDGRNALNTWERLHSPGDLGTWLVARFSHLDPSVTERELADALMLREAIAKTAVAASRNTLPEASDIDVINLFAATPDLPPSLTGGTRQAGASRHRATQALSTIARDAIRMVGPDAGGGIRECSASNCRIVYFDTSRSGNRRWCSMQRCGNRAKVRAHRERSALERYSTI